MRVNRRMLLNSIAGSTVVGAAALGLARRPGVGQASVASESSTGTDAAALPTQPPPSGPPYTALTFDGICENPDTPGDVVVVPPGSRARFIEGSSVLLASSAAAGCAAPGSKAGVGVGSAEYCVPFDAPARQLDLLPSVQAAREWLAAGRTPGAGTPYADMGTRALLDLRLALRPNGALLAGPTGPWRLVWPRDASWAAAAFSATGHHAEALRILKFLTRVQIRDGSWAARTLPDGSGHVPDARKPQLDAVGWVPWAAWSWYTAAPADQARSASLHALWPGISAAADVAATSLQSNGLPQPASDYWESGQADVTIGNAAALSCGLRAAAALGHTLGDPRSAVWSAAEARLAAATTAAFAPTGYHRTPAADSPVDAAVTWLGPPLARKREVGAGVAQAVADAVVSLRVSNGGLTAGLPGPGATGNAWTPETAFFALYDAASGSGSPTIWLDWLDRHRTPLGSLAEQVTPIDGPASMAPLAWTNAIVLLALSALDRPLQVP